MRTGDDYTWLALVQAWEDTGHWSPVVAAHNAPVGLETHLTSPFAAVVRGLGGVLRLWRPDGERTREAGMLSGPVLHVATTVVLAWGAWRLVGAGGALLTVAAFLTTSLSFHRFDIGNFDHHALHAFLSMLLVALLIHAAVGKGRVGRTALLGGVVAGLGIWSGVELVIPAGIAGLALGLAWAFWGGRWRALAVFGYALGLASMLMVAVVVEHPSSRWASTQLDRVSGAYVLAGALLATAAGGVAWMQSRWPLAGTPARVSVVAAMAGSVLLILWLSIPDIFLGPYGDTDSVVEEHRRGVPGDRSMASVLGAIRGFSWYQLCLLGVAGIRCVWGLREPAARDAWLLVGLGLLLGMVAAFHQYRLLGHYEMFAALAVGGAAAGAGRMAWVRGSAVGRAAAVPLALLVLASPYVAWGVGIRLGQEVTPSLRDTGLRDRGCDWPALGRALASRLGRGVGSGTIATYAAPGPELAWFSGRLGVLATGCHCNSEGMRAARAILLSVPDSAREVARARQVEFIVQCPAASGWQGHAWYVERSGPDGVYARLARDDPPDWLDRVPSAELGVHGFDVWRTEYGGQAHGEPSE